MVAHRGDAISHADSQSVLRHVCHERQHRVLCWCRWLVSPPLPQAPPFGKLAGSACRHRAEIQWSKGLTMIVCSPHAIAA